MICRQSTTDSCTPCLGAPKQNAAHPGLPLLFPSTTEDILQCLTRTVQNLSSITCTYTAGFVDLVGVVITLPKGTQQTFLGLAFCIEGSLMLAHQKHQPLDATAHRLLGMTMLATAAFVFLEIRFQHSLLVSAGRAGTVMLQGVWLCTMAQMLFAGKHCPADPGAQKMFGMLFLLIMSFMSVQRCPLWLLPLWVQSASWGSFGFPQDAGPSVKLAGLWV